MPLTASTSSTPSTSSTTSIISSATSYAISVLSATTPPTTAPSAAFVTASSTASPTAAATCHEVAVGAGVGVPLLLAFIAALGLFLWERRRRRAYAGGDYHQAPHSTFFPSRSKSHLSKLDIDRPPVEMADTSFESAYNAAQRK